MKSVGFNPEQVNFVPIESLKGDNIVKKSENMPWHKGKTLAEGLEDFKPQEKPTKLPLRWPLQDVYTIRGIGTVPVGRIETGILKIGDQVVAMPSGAKGDIKTIEMHHEQMQKAEPGDNVGVSIRGIGKTDIKRGDVIGPVSNPPTVAKEFTGQIVVLNHPTVMTVGYAPVFHVNTSQVSCRIIEIVKKIDPRTGATIAENPDFLKNGDAAIIKVQPTQPLCIEKQADIPQLSRFAIRDMGRTVAAGMCIDVVKRD